MMYSILFIGVVLFLGQVFSSLFEKTRLPDVLPLMVLGMLMGPVFQVVSPEVFGQAGQIFTTLALIIVLFKSGVDFKISSLRGAWGQGIVLTTLTFVVIMASVAYTVIGMWHLPGLLACMIGAIVADNSTAVIIPLLPKLQIGKTAKTVLFLEANLTGVYSIVIAFALLGVALRGGVLSAADVSWQVVRSFGIGVVFAMVAGIFWTGILHHVRKLENAVSLTFAFVLLVYGLSSFIGGDGAIATLTFGMVAGNMRLIQRLWLRKIPFILHGGHALNKGEKDFFSEVEFIFKTLFFVYMGISMHVGRMDWVLLGVVLVVVKAVVRIPLVNRCLQKEMTRKECSVIWAMFPNGLVSAVLAAMIAQQLPKEGVILQDVIYSVIFFSVLTSNFMSFRIEKGGLVWLINTFFKRHARAEETSPASNTVSGQE